MKKKTAKKVLHLMLELGAALDASVAQVKAEEPEDEFKKYRTTAGKLMGEMFLRVIEPICTEYPELRPLGLYLPGEKVHPKARHYRVKGVPAPRRVQRTTR